MLFTLMLNLTVRNVLGTECILLLKTKDVDYNAISADKLNTLQIIFAGK